MVCKLGLKSVDIFQIEILLVLCSLKDSTLPADSALHDEAEKRQK